MVYKVGKYKYDSIKHYQRLLFMVWAIFVICLFLLFVLRDMMNDYLYCFTIIVDISMILHLYLRYLHSIKRIKYVFNEY